jgi:transcription elongation GreA/GreB family factor
MMKKLDVFAALLALLEARLYARKAAADTAREAATDVEARADSKYDTQGLESSYLARGHAMMLEDLAEDFRRLKAYRLPAYAPTDAIGEGALVEVEMDGESMWFIILPGGGGTDVMIGDVEVTVVTSETPLGEQLIGKRAGDAYLVRPGGPGGTIRTVS